MAFKTGEEGKDGKVDKQYEGEKKDGEGEGRITKSALDFRNDRWKLTPTPANGNRLGEALSYQVKIGSGVSAKMVQVKTYIPGIARVGFVPVFGVSKDAGSAISTLASTVYADILSALKRSSLRFDPTAVVVHMLALDSMYCAYDMAVRAYRALNTTDVDNAYLAKNLVEACGFNYEDLLANKTNLYFWFSTARAALKQYAVPKNFAMIGAHRAMCTHAYHDSPSAKAQLYVFTPDFLWSWAKVDTAGGLKSVAMAEANGGEYMTYARFTGLFNDMLQALLNSTDFKDINASIRATYPEVDTYAFDMPGIDDTLPLMIDEVVLNSLLNATTLGQQGAESINTFAPTDAMPNTFVITPSVLFTNQSLSNVVNSINDCPTSEEMVSNMRWHVAFDTAGLDASANRIPILSCGTEVITYIRAHSLNDECPFIEYEINGLKKKVTFFTIGSANIREIQNETDTGNAHLVSSDFYPYLAQAFRWRPIQLVARYYSYDQIDTTVWSVLATDWNYQATVSATDLVSWHTALLFSACSL